MEKIIPIRYNPAGDDEHIETKTEYDILQMTF